MIDVDKILDQLNTGAVHHRRALYIVVAAISALLLWWIVSVDAGRHEVDTKLTEIKATAETAGRRADAIVDVAKQREEAARDETRMEMSAVSDDALPAVLSGLLAEYRGTGK